MIVFDQIRAFLDEQRIEYKLSEHEAVKTSEEAARIRGTELRTGAKAIVIKAEDTFYLFVLPGDRKMDWKKIKALLNTKRLRLATQEEAEQVTGAKIGAIPPLGNILGLPTYLDKKVLENEWINFNPGSRTHSIAMKSSDLARIVNPIIEEFSE